MKALDLRRGELIADFGMVEQIEVNFVEVAVRNESPGMAVPSSPTCQITP